MKHLTIILILVCCFSVGFSQKIEIRKSLGAVSFFQDGKKLRLKEVSEQLAVNPKAAGIFKSARSSESLGAVLGGIGGALIGYPLGTALAGGEAEWTLAAVGAGIIVLSFPIYSSAGRKAETAIAFYNEAYPYSFSDQQGIELSVVGNGRGVGLSVSF